jgi:mannose-1-phosphate guanylyltransferase/mannose-6-phosphate isomerase
MPDGLRRPAAQKLENAMSLIHPVILCGGSGTRLWPVSRKAYPKQFAPFWARTSALPDDAWRASPPKVSPRPW